MEATSEVSKLIGTDFINQKKEKVAISKDVKLVGVYFSAHWCPPCRGFTPVLANHYKTWNKANK